MDAFEFRKRKDNDSRFKSTNNSVFSKKIKPDKLDKLLKKAKVKKDFNTLIAFARSEDPTVRLGAIARLSEIDGLTEKAIDALIVAVNDQNHSVRNTSVQALRKLGPAAHKAIPSLIQKIRSPRWPWYEKIEAIAALSGMGKESYAAIPVLLKAAKDEEENMRIAAAFALGAIGEHVAIETLETLALHDPSERVKDAALKGLRDMTKK